MKFNCPSTSREIHVRQGFIYLSCARSQWSHYPAETMASPIRGGISCICRGCNIQGSRDIQLFVLHVYAHVCYEPSRHAYFSLSLSLSLCLWIFMLSGRIIRNERQKKKKNKDVNSRRNEKWLELIISFYCIFRFVSPRCLTKVRPVFVQYQQPVVQLVINWVFGLVKSALWRYACFVLHFWRESKRRGFYTCRFYHLSSFVLFNIYNIILYICWYI